MGAGPPAEPEEEPRRPDVPARDTFVEPVRGQAAPPTAHRPLVLDDALPWEGAAGQDDEE